MKLYQSLGVVLIVLQIICHGGALDSSTSTITEVSAPVKDYNIVVITIQKLGMKNVSPVNIPQISATLQYCQQKIEIITQLIVTQYPASSAENLLELLTTIHDVFDAISETTNMVEKSLNGIVGCVDLVVLDVQIAVQVLVEAVISNCEFLSETSNRSDDAMGAAIYCLSSAIKTLLTSMSDLAEKISTSSEIVDADAVTGLQLIVQTILNIVDRVMFSLKHVRVVDSEAVEPSFEKLSLIIQRLAILRLNFVSKISPMIISPVAEVSDSLRSNMDQLSLVTGKNIESMVEALNSVEDTINEKTFSPIVSSLINTLQPMLLNISIAIHSIQGISDSSAYSTDVSLQNLMSTIKCLTYYIAILAKVLPTIETEDVGGNLQFMLCFIASNIQTLIDGVTLAVEKALVDLICSSPTIDKVLLEQQLLELQKLMEPVILMLENIVRTSIGLIQNILSFSACALGDNITDIIDDMNRLINSLRQIVKGITESVVSSKQLLTPDNQVDEAINTLTLTDVNVLSICIKTFEEVAQNSIKLRVLFNSSIQQIRRYLIEM